MPHTSSLCTRGGTVKWPRSSVASQCDFSHPSRGCAVCSDPNANRPSQTRSESTDKSSSGTSPKPWGAPAQGSSEGPRRQHAGTNGQGGVQARLLRACVCTASACCPSFVPLQSDCRYNTSQKHAQSNALRAHAPSPPRQVTV